MKLLLLPTDRQTFFGSEVLVLQSYKIINWHWALFYVFPIIYTYGLLTKTVNDALRQVLFLLFMETSAYNLWRTSLSLTPRFNATNKIDYIGPLKNRISTWYSKTSTELYNLQLKNKTVQNKHFIRDRTKDRQEVLTLRWSRNTVSI